MSKVCCMPPWLPKILFDISLCPTFQCKLKCSDCTTRLNKSSSGIIRGMGSANKRRHDNVMLFLIGWAHTENDHCISMVSVKPSAVLWYCRHPLWEIITSYVSYHFNTCITGPIVDDKIIYRKVFKFKITMHFFKSGSIHCLLRKLLLAWGPFY